MNLFEMKKRREELLTECDRMLNAAKDNGNSLPDADAKKIDEHTGEVNRLSADILRVEKHNTLRAQFPTGRVIVDTPKGSNASRRHKRPVMTEEYADEFATWAGSRGRIIGESMTAYQDNEGGFLFPYEPVRSASLTESVTTAGGFAVPSTVAGEIVPLAPPEMGVQKLATVLPTENDIKFPRKSAHGTAASKAEGAAFGGTDPAIDQFTLSAFMAGHIEDASWELLQDVGAFQAFIQDDILLSLATFKENWFVNGTGTGQAQGLIGNVGTGVPQAQNAVDSFGNLFTVAQTFDVQGTLNAIYQPNASWLMRRASSIVLRKAQFQANLFEPVFNRVGAQDYLHGYPVEYSDSMPAVAANTTVALFGDFKRCYLIGERGGSGVSVKILDQTKASQGLLEVLGYQRVDGRVRRSEAIQAITLHV